MDSRPLSNKRFHLIGTFESKKEIHNIIKGLGGKVWRHNCSQPPTDLILAFARTKFQEAKICNEAKQFEEKGVKFKHDLKWLLDLWGEETGRKPNESLSSTRATESDIIIPSRQIVPATPPPIDITIERSGEGQENLLSTRTDLAVRKTVPNTLPSNIQDKVMNAIVEPIFTRQRAPAGAQNRVIERSRVLRKKEVLRPPLQRAGEVSIPFIPDVRLYYTFLGHRRQCD
jgi:hypothetical protein